MSIYHIPVLTKNIIEYLNIKKGCWYIDATLGGGGHTELILKKGGKTLGIDLDPEAILEVSQNYTTDIEAKNLILYRGNFADLKQFVTRIYLEIPHYVRNDSRKANNDTKVCGVLFDLGVSSYQLESPMRGFSFQKDAPLDMRMDPSVSVKAGDLVNGLYESELIDLLRKFGEEKFAKKIAKKIVEERKNKKIETTKQLADLVASIKPRKIGDSIHPATQVFQALRIAVNDELNNLKTALPNALDVLKKNGRLVVVSFHSLEDRIVKDFFKKMEDQGIVRILTKKPVTPSEKEILQNPRSRSAKLRVLEKI